MGESVTNDPQAPEGYNRYIHSMSVSQLWLESRIVEEHAFGSTNLKWRGRLNACRNLLRHRVGPTIL